MLVTASSEHLAQIKEILRQLDAAPGAKDVQNRRRAKRLKICVEIEGFILGATTDASIRVFTRNISTSGLAFVCRRPFKSGERVAFSFHVPGQTPKLVLAKVSFVRYIRSGIYEMGAEFLESINDANDMHRIPHHWHAAAKSREIVPEEAPKTKRPSRKKSDENSATEPSAEKRPETPEEKPAEKSAQSPNPEPAPPQAK